MPEPALNALKATEREALRLQRSLRNAKQAFRPDAGSYRLALDRFGGFLVAYREGSTDEQVISDSFEKDIYFSQMPEYEPGEDHIILDIGAHIGTFSLLAATKVPKGIVYAVEACKESYNYLRINIRLNKLTNVRPSFLALGDKKGDVFLRHDEENWGHSIMRGLSFGGEAVPSNTLAGFMVDNAIPKLDFIKFNCEGAEFPILMRTPPEVLARIDKMLILYHLDVALGYSLTGLIDFLNKSSFRTDIRNRTTDRGWIVAQHT